MAAIDKIYGTRLQYGLFKDWCEANCITALPFFTDPTFWDDPEWLVGEHPICNLPQEIDVVLIKTCPIPFVQARLKEQYEHYERYRENGVAIDNE